jgi:hypothetical protein
VKQHPRPYPEPFWTLENISALRCAYLPDLYTAENGDKMRRTPIQVEERLSSLSGKGGWGCLGRKAVRHPPNGMGLQFLQVNLWTHCGK